MREGSLFSGYNGLGMAVSEVFGAEPAWFSEIDDAPSKILAHHWPDVPNHGDITKIDWDAVEPVDILSGGFPCQDVSLAGKRAGMTPDTRSGLWAHFAYAISKLRPRYVVVENVRGLLSAEAHSDVEPCTWCLGDGSGEPALRALGAVSGDLAELGYDTQWIGLPAADVGAPHLRFRVFILATDTGGEAVRLRSGLRASGSTRQWWGRPDDHATQAASDAGDDGCERRTERDGWPSSRFEPSLRHDPDGRGATTADPSSEGLQESEGVASGLQEEISTPSGTLWGQYAPAIHRWERVLGRVAPAPTEAGPKGGERLAPRFVEWMQGLPDGHVTGVPGVSRNAQLKALGNGVVRQQAEAALRALRSAALGVAA